MEFIMKQKNPLFVVSCNGDVEEASDFLDAIIKKYGLKPIMEAFNIVIDFIIENMKGHQAFILINGFLEEFIKGLENILKMIDPLLAFKLFKK